VAVEPADEVRCLSVDSGESSLSTSISPGDDSRQLVAAHEWSTGISLAGVLATFIKTSADHGVSDVRLSISTTAVIIADNGDGDLHEGTSKAASLGGGSPSRDNAFSSSRVFLHVRGQGDGSNHRAAEVSLSGKFEQTDVVVDGPGVIVLMEHNLGNSNVHLISIIFIKMVVSNSDSKTAGRLSAKKL
jgi:hypothetical protein